MRRRILLMSWVGLASAAGGCNVIRPSGGGVPRTPMTQEVLERSVKSLGNESRGEGGAVTFVYKGVRMAAISDAVHDRMRIVAATAQASKMPPEQTRAVLEANFHTALDARYAVDGDVLYAAFIHPLSSLSEKELRSAVEQVANLAGTYGDSYTSGELVFGGKGG